MEELESLFDECQSNMKYDEPPNSTATLINKLVETIEADFTGIATVETDRLKEKKELTDKIHSLQKRLISIKNPRNLASMPFGKRSIITKNLSEKREVLRKEIEQYKFKLDEIKVEEGTREPEKTKKEIPEEKVNSQKSKWDTNPYGDLEF